MKKVAAVILVLLTCVSLSACAMTEQKTYPAEDYCLKLPYKEDFRILQLCDIHLGNKDNREKQYSYLDLTISDSDADLIIMVGDLFTFADKKTAKELFSFIDSYSIPWTLTFGNHDEQCYFSIDWLTDYLNSYGSNCVFRDIHGDDVFGNSNFAINLMKDESVFEQLIVMDSNRYCCGDYWGYDYIKEDQINWYERLVKDTEAKNGATVDSLLFFHIPFPEFQDAWDEAQAGSPEAILEYGELNEPVSCPQYNSGMFDKILELGSSKGVFVAHDHVNNFRIKYKGVYLSYGINSTDRIYYKDGMIGGQIITIHGDHTLGFEPVYHTYGEVRDE